MRHWLCVGHPHAAVPLGVPPHGAGTITPVDLSPRSLLERSRTPAGKKMVRYSLVSVVSVVVSQVVLFAAQSFWSARTSNIVAVCVSAIPSYYLNRAWAWGKTGKSHLMKEIVPFWSLALLGLIFSTWAADYAETNAHHWTGSDLGVRLIVNIAALAAFGVLWVGKFFIFNRLMFAHQPEPSLPAGG
jgi:putative flippase GtrA